jgi:hypothetical protein
MRKFILVDNAFLAVLWLILIIVSRMPGQDYATEGLHGIMIFVVLPTFAYGGAGCRSASVSPASRCSCL